MAFFATWAALHCVGAAALGFLVVLTLSALLGALSWLPWVLLVAWLGAIVYYRLCATGAIRTRRREPRVYN